MDITAARSLPELAGLDDDQIVDALHQAYYPDLPRDEVAKSLGIKPTAAPRPETTWGDRAKDTGISLLQGAVAVPQAAVGVADLVTGGAAGKLAEDVGFRPKEATDFLGERLSDAQKGANKEVQDAEGFWGTFKAAVSNPSVVFQSVVQSLPSMGAGGVVARGVLGASMTPRLLAKLSAMAPEAREAAILGMQTTAGAVGEGAVQAGSAAEQARTDNPLGTLDGKGALSAVASGVGDTIIARFSGRLANKLGIADADTMLAGAAVNPRAAKSVVKAALGGMVTEGLLEELPQSVQEQVWQNHAAGRPLDEGVNQAAVLGMLSGAAMGGGANLLNAARKPKPDDILNAPDVDAALQTAQDALLLPPPTISVTLGGTAVTPEQRADLVQQEITRRAAGMMGGEDVTDVQAKGTPPVEVPPTTPPSTPPAFPDPFSAAKPVDLDANEARMHRDADRDAQALKEHDPLTLPRKGLPELDAEYGKGEGDTIQKNGAPWPSEAAAMLSLKMAKKKGRAVPVAGGFIARPNKETPNAAPTPENKPDGARGAQPAAAAPATDAATAQRPDDQHGGLPAPDTGIAGGSAAAVATQPAPGGQVVGAGDAARTPGDGVLRPVNDAAVDGRDERPADGRASGPVSAPVAAGANDAGTTTGAAKTGSEQSLTEAGAQWTRMTEIERRAVAGRTAGKAKALDRIVSQKWEDLHSGWQKSLARVMNTPGAPIAPRETSAPTSHPTASAGPRVIINRLGPDGLTDAERAAGKPSYADKPAEVTSETARRGDFNVKNHLGKMERATVTEGGTRGRFAVKIGGESMGQFQMDDQGAVSRIEARANWAEDSVRDAAMQFVAQERAKTAPAAAEQPRDQDTGQFAEAPADTLPAGVRRREKGVANTKARIAAEAARAAYFTPGNVVRGYGGFDEVLAYNPPTEPGGAWSVRVHEVKEATPNNWVRVGRPQDARQHSTEPEERELRNGPRAQLSALPASEVPYTVPRADGKVHPDAEPRSNPRAAAEPAKIVTDKAEIRPYRRSDGSVGYEAVPIQPPAAPNDELIVQSIRPGSKPHVVKVEPAPAASTNKVFTDEMAAAARARLKAKLGRLNSLLDPQDMLDGITLAGYHVEKGARSFAAFAQAMLADLGEGVRAHLKSFYMGVKYSPAAAEFSKDMSSAAFVEEFDLSHIAAPSDTDTLETQPPAADTGANDGSSSPTLDVDRAGPGPLEGAPSGDVRAPAGERKTGDGTGRSSDGDQRGDARPDAAGGNVAGGVGAGAGTVPVSTGGAEQGKGPAKPRVPRTPRADGGPGLFDDAGGTGGVNPAPNAAPTPAPQFKPSEDFTIEDDLALGDGGEKTKFKNNVAAIRLLRELEAADRMATPDEQRTLAQYVGWGALSKAFDADRAEWAKEHAELKDLLSPEEFAAARQSTRYAHYTSRQIIQDGVYAALHHFGFTGGRVLEPGAGVGNFIGMMPADMRSAGRITAIEREPIAAGIAKNLYPLQNVQQADFTAFKGTDGYFDAVVGNPPFASDPQTDTSGRKHLGGLTLHNYFFAKSVDLMREGGILAQVVTNSFMDAAGDRARKYISDRTKLMGAIRLPNNAFSKNAGTEVTTDIIFLQKRPEAEWGNKATRQEAKAWLDVVKQTDRRNGGQYNLNQYFIDHPEMMLGDFGAHGTMYGPNQPALIARPGQDTLALLREAVQRLPGNVFVDRAVLGTDAAIENATKALTNPPVQEGGFYVEGDKLIQRVPDIAGEPRGREINAATQWTAKTPLGEAGYQKIRALTQMRTTLRGLLAAELSGDKDMDALRTTLGKQYDDYTKAHGLLGDPGTARVFDDDPDFPLLLSLEHEYRPGIGMAAAKRQGIKPTKSAAKKAPIFMRRVVDARKPVQKVETPADALAVSMAERGKLDTVYIGQLLGKDPQEVLKELSTGDKPQLFLDPATDEYALRDAYLSGNVRAKLEQAKQSGLSMNVRELEKVQPEDVGAHEISARIGSPWVPTSVYEDFAKELFGEGSTARVHYMALNSSYTISTSGTNEVNTTNKWGTPQYSGPELMSALLNNRTIRVMHPKVGDTPASLNVEATDMANTKAQEIRDRFQDWLFAEPERSELLVRTYNDTNNNYVTRNYDGSWMTFPGKVPNSVLPGDGGISFRRHQRNAIARIVQDRTALLDHVVGAGKTFTIVAAAMELRRTGLAKKPLVAVPNHLVKQWAADFYRLYPGANILTATKKDFEKVNRRRFLAKIATGDWDAVVIAHSSFGFIKPGAEFEAEFNERQVKMIMDTIAAVQDGDGEKAQKKRTVKQLEGMKERLQNRIKSLRDKAMDDLLDFEQLGVDQLFVDEAHMFKNLMFTTKMQGVSGLGDGSGSQRAYDMYVKSQEVLEKNGRGQGLVFATGTPVSNSLGEKYHMMRYLMPRQMEELGFQSFDAWANTFAAVQQVWMQKFSGDGYKPQNRMSDFVNVHELLKMFDQVADTVTLDDIKKAYKEENNGEEFPIPRVKTGRRQPVSLEKSAAQIAYMEHIAARAKILEARRGPPRKGDDNALVIMGDARKAAMDIRLISPAKLRKAIGYDVDGRDPGGRIDRSAQEIHQRYQQWNHVKGTQLVFADLGTPVEHAATELKEYEALMERINAATDDVRLRAELGAEDALVIVNDAEDAQADIDVKGQDWLDGIEAAQRGFSIYDDLKAALIERGMPEDHIAFIHDYGNDERKATLFRKVNAGDIRVLIGSTAKMGAGTNVQERIVAEHHLDVPWRPSDVEQREGRIERQGNSLLWTPQNPNGIKDFEVEILAYVTKDTLDMRMWQIQEVKLKMIHQLRTRQISRDIDNAFEDMEMSAGEMQAAATGNMDLLREIQARSDIKKLEQKKRSFDAQRSDLINRKKRAAEKLAQLPAQIKGAEVLAEGSREYRKALEDNAESFKVTIDGKDFTDRHLASAYLLDKIDGKIYVRTVEKDGKKLREEISAEQWAALPTGDERAFYDPKAAPLDLTMNGDLFTARAKLQEAWSNVAGDREPIVWEYQGKTFNRRTALAVAQRQAVADAVADEKEVDLGKVGPFAVTAEGQTGKWGKFLDVVMTYKGRKIEGDIGVPEGDVSTQLAERMASWASRKAEHAADDLQYLKGDLERAQKQKAELDAADDVGDVWPEQSKLEEARNRHKAILARLGGQKDAPPATGDEPAFGQGAATGGMSPALAQHAADTVASVWDNAPQIVALPSIARAPQKVQDDARRRMERGGGKPKAVFYDGTVYLFADALASPAEAVEYTYHEVLGHFGMHGHLGPELDKELKAVATLRKEDISAMYERTGKERSAAMDLRMAEEVVAYMAQTKPELSLVRRVIAAIKNFLRDHVPGFGSLNMSDADIIQKFVLPARQFVEGAPTDPNGGGEFDPAFGQARGLNSREIQVNGKWRPIETAGGELIAPTFHGQSEFWKKHADAFALDDKGRPKATPAEIKALMGDNPDDAMFAQGAPLNDPRALWGRAKQSLADMSSAPGTMHWWNKSIGTEYHLAQKYPAFKAVFDRVQDFINDSSLYANEAADLARTILPKLEGWRDVVPKLLGGSGKSPISAAFNRQIQAPINEGTLIWTRGEDGKPVRVDELEKAADKMSADQKAQAMLRAGKLPESVLKMWRGLPLDQYQQAVSTAYKNRMLTPGIVWTDAELREKFGLGAAQIALYREFRAAVDRSITQLAVSDLVRFVGQDGDFIRDQVLAAPDVMTAAKMLVQQIDQLIVDNPERQDVLNDTAAKVKLKADKAHELIQRGYAPLSRFGHYTITVRAKSDDGEPGEVLYFGMYESRPEAAKAARQLAAEEDFQGATLVRGTISHEQYKLFAGVNPDTIELFGEMLGLEGAGNAASDQAFQQFLKSARSNRSTMKRMIHRKGTAGFSEDVPRVLASFLYSNARQASRNLHSLEIDRMGNEIAQAEGELKDHAVKLIDYVKNPVQEAHQLRGLLFAQFLGGSIASAMVNMSQPFMMTLPYLSQFGAREAVSNFKWALLHGWKDTTGDPTLDAAIKRRVEDGTIAPHEVHQLLAQSLGKAELKSGDGTLTGDAAAQANNALARLQLGWGKFFSTAELFNRRVTYVAAYRLAKEKKMADPDAFAKKAVDESQGVYNKGNKPVWARGAVGSVAMTFKQYSIAYLEFVARMWTAGEPGSPERAAGQRAVYFAAAMLLMMGGAGGLPFEDDVADVVDGIMQRLGYNWNTKQKRQEMLEKAFGRGFGHVLEKGVSGLPGVPIDVAGRFGMGNLIPATGLLQKKADHTSDVLEIGGPAASLAKRFFQASNLAAEGRIVDAGLLASPVAASNIAKAIDMASSGIYKDSAGKKVMDVDGWDAMSKLIGFQPSAVARVQDADRSAQVMVEQVKMREREISQQWAQALADGDRDGATKAREAIAAWNAKNEDTPIKIKLGDVLRRAKNMRMDRATRIEKSAPSEVRGTVREMLREP
jgi:N12 class adenine-specific DNA methylase